MDNMIKRSEVMAQQRSVRIWDWPVRFSHWALTLCIAALYATGEYGWLTMDWHFRFGFMALGLLIFRILWGFFGSEHARFSTFVRGPRAVIEYVRGWASPAYRASLGHNPLGAMAVIALLLLTLAQVLTGLFSSDQIEVFGPLAERVSQKTSDWLTEWHHLGQQLLLIMIGLHIVAIAGYYLGKRENLLNPMLTGRKAVEAGADGRPGRWWVAVILVLVAFSAVWAISVYGPL